MLTGTYCIATFFSIHDALHFEKVIKSREVPLQLIPVPRQISSSCGTAARFQPEYKEQIEAIVSELGLELENIYFFQEEKKKGNLSQLLSKLKRDQSP